MTMRRTRFAANGTVTHYDPRTLEEAQREMRDVLAGEFTRRRDAGITVSLGGQPVEIATHLAARSDLSELVSLLERRAAAGEVAPTQTAATRSGLVFTADLTLARALRDAVSDYVSKVWAHDAVLNEELASAATIADVDAIRAGVGWPSQDYTGGGA